MEALLCLFPTYPSSYIPFWNNIDALVETVALQAITDYDDNDETVS